MGRLFFILSLFLLISSYNVVQVDSSFAGIWQSIIHTFFGCSCGNRPGSDERITAGNETTIANYPWVAQVLNRSDYVLCGATILNPYFILSAAHCFEDHPLDNYYMKVGSQTREANDGKRFEIEKLYVPAEYETGAVPLFEDIALVKVSSIIVFSNTIQPACLPTASDYNAAEAIILGWGAIEAFSSLSNNLRKGLITAYNPEFCKTETNYPDSYFRDGVLCGKSVSTDRITDACQGDSGGPLIQFYQQNKGTLYGITSYGGLCADPDLGGIYTDVYFYKNWILQRMDRGAICR